MVSYWHESEIQSDLDNTEKITKLFFVGDKQLNKQQLGYVKEL